MELARAGVTVNAVIPVAATGMTETVPFLKPYVEALAAGEALPPFARRELGFGSPRMPQDWLLPGIRRRGRHHRAGHRHRR